MPKELVSRTGFPKSGDYLAFARWYSELNNDEQLLVFVSPTKDDPHMFSYAVFPLPVPLTAESAALITTAKAIATRMGTNGSTVVAAESSSSRDASTQPV